MTWFRVGTIWTGLSGSPGYTAHYIDISGSASASLASTAVWNFWEATKGSRHTSVTATMDDEVVEYNDPNTPVAFHPVTAAISLGTSADQLIPQTAQMLMQWRTAAIGANGHRIVGHTFIPGYTEAANAAGGVPDAGIRGTHVTAGNALVAAGLFIASRRTNTFIDVATVGCWSKWASLPSRRD